MNGWLPRPFDEPCHNHEPGWEDVQSLWKDDGSCEEFEETFGPHS